MGEAITLQRRSSKIDVHLTSFASFSAFEKYIGGKFGLKDEVSKRGSVERKFGCFFYLQTYIVSGCGEAGAYPRLDARAAWWYHGYCLCAVLQTRGVARAVHCMWYQRRSECVSSIIIIFIT